MRRIDHSWVSATALAILESTAASSPTSECLATRLALVLDLQSVIFNHLLSLALLVGSERLNLGSFRIVALFPAIWDYLFLTLLHITFWGFSWPCLPSDAQTSKQHVIQEHNTRRSASWSGRAWQNKVRMVRDPGSPENHCRVLPVRETRPLHLPEPSPTRNRQVSDQPGRTRDLVRAV